MNNDKNERRLFLSPRSDFTHYINSYFSIRSFKSVSFSTTSDGSLFTLCTKTRGIGHAHRRDGLFPFWE